MTGIPRLRCRLNCLCLGVAALAVAGSASSSRADDVFELKLRKQTTDSQGLQRVVYDSQTWKASETAVIVCDMWDAHHCLNAVRRVSEMAPRMSDLLHKARSRGATIIHAPSSCMEFYRGHPARTRAQTAPQAGNVPGDIGQWCHWKDEAEEDVGYPIDHSDGGEDDDMFEHQRWHEYLRQVGRNPDAPWKRQTKHLKIDPTRDYITDDGVENWNILMDQGIQNVMLVGVHTNMCVLGRPFGLRQLSKNGMNVVLVRDMTDTMYNPDRPPFVSHFSGTDLVVEHIERHVCPTITSNQVLGGSEFRFSADRRPHLVFVIGEDEYQTRHTLPDFARHYLQSDFRLSFVFADEEDRNAFPGLDVLDQADVLIVSVRRRAPPERQLMRIRQWVEKGKPVVGIRTASHAFALRQPDQAPSGHGTWPEFDAHVFGGNYHGHHGNKGADEPGTFVWVPQGPKQHPITRGLPVDEAWKTTSWLYKTSPVSPAAQVLVMGRVEGREPYQPVAWTLHRSDGGKSFYTSLGHVDDFDDYRFRQLLFRGIYWAADKAMPGVFPHVAEIP